MNVREETAPDWSGQDGALFLGFAPCDPGSAPHRHPEPTSEIGRGRRSTLIGNGCRTMKGSALMACSPDASLDATNRTSAQQF